MNINKYFDNNNLLKQWDETKNLLTDAKVSVSFWGGRVIKSSKYEGSISLDKVAKKIFNAAKKRSEADDFTISERIAGIGISKKICCLYKNSDSQIKKANWFTRLINKIREFSIFPYTPRFYTERCLKDRFIGFSKAKAIQEFGVDFNTKSKGSFGPPPRYMIAEKYILAKLSPAA